MKDEELIKKRIEYLNHPENFMQFEQYMTDQWLPSTEKEGCEKKEWTKKAYRNFYEKVKGSKIASHNTVRKWFGIGGKAVPKREHIFRLALWLHLPEEEIQDYLIRGMLEPGIQINDYQEMIYLYGSKKQLSWEQCQDMILVFEQTMEKDLVWKQDTHTEQLWKWYRQNETKEPEEFLVWMCSQAGLLKGYSKVAWNAFVFWKGQVLEYVRKDAGGCLYDMLRETDYFQWLAGQNIPEKDWENHISQYINNVSRRKEKQLTETEKKQILYLKWMIKDSKGRTTDLLSELYASAVQAEEPAEKRRLRYYDRKEFSLPKEIPLMTNKYVSQILGVAEMKGHYMRLSQMRAALQARDEEEACPQWIREEWNGYSRTPVPQTVKEAKKELKHMIQNQKKRCQYVKREDLLPMIHYVAQCRYLEEISESSDMYSVEEAKQIFVSMANEVMDQCQMERVNKRYYLDYFLMAGYGENELFSLSDMLESAKK